VSALVLLHFDGCIGAETYVSDGSGITGRLACAGKGTFVSGVLTVIVVVPPGTVEVIRRVIVLVTSSLSLYERQQLCSCSRSTMR
jgi:hypothetical protein